MAVSPLPQPTPQQLLKPSTSCPFLTLPTQRQNPRVWQVLCFRSRGLGR